LGLICSVDEYLRNHIALFPQGDEIDQVNRLLGPMPSTSEAVKTALEAQRTKELLSIESRNLNPNNELKRIFGVKIVQSEQRYVCVSDPRVS
jgi:hypothetical protein